jgi:hypothetical protein
MTSEQFSQIGVSPEQRPLMTVIPSEVEGSRSESAKA